MNWHYVEQGKQLGPVSDDWILEFERSGKISADTLVWHEGMTDWKPLKEVRSDLRPTGQLLTTPSQPAAETAAQPTMGENGPEAVCAECGKIFPVDEMIRHGNLRICATCKPVFVQKLSEGANLQTGELRYAGFWIRLVAKLLDGLIMGVCFGVLFGIAFALTIPMMRSNSSGPNAGPPVLLIGILELVVFALQIAYVIFFVGKFGATPGKMACKLKIVAPDGKPIGYGRATGRFFAELLSAMICDIGYIMVAFDKEKRGLHDHICSTRVIYK